ncbi:MAG TPA: YhjD/YihY/BrkB family envelope integrity protein [Kineosporiaceae bacterium]|nr:YhjD/YihY/BrkB family envelope integrity protein [Kineosporiaceae bacterium]
MTTHVEPHRRAGVATILAATRARLNRRELAVSSAAATLYGALAVVPSLLVAIALAALLLGRDDVHRYGRLLAGTLPTAMGAGGAADRIVDAGLALSPAGVSLAVVMGSAYGEGLSRAFVRVTPGPQDAAPPTWWLRAATLPLLGLAPLMLAGLLVATPWLAGINNRSGWQGIALASYLSLTWVWVLTWLPLTWTFRVVGPGRPRWRCAFGGAVVTGAFVSGFLQGFLLFLSLPVDLGRPFGGLTGVGVASALLLWLWVLHAVVLVGYALTWSLDEYAATRPDRD